MNNNNSPSWGVVILVLILFWPVGLYLLCKKVSSNKSSASKRGTGIYTVGRIFVGLGILYMILWLTDSMNIGEDTSMALTMSYIITIFFGGGFLMIHIGKKRKAKAKRLYMEDLQRSIIYSTFNGKTIEKAETIIRTDEPKIGIVEPKNEKIVPKVKAVACKNCGANNRVISDQVTECEFCGSLISG